MEPERSRDPAKAGGRLDELRCIYALGSFLSLALTGFAIQLLPQSEIEIWFAISAVCICSLSMASQVVATMLLPRQPVLWSTVAATFAALVVLWMWFLLGLRGPTRESVLPFLPWILWPAFFWGLVFVARRAEHLHRSGADVEGAADLRWRSLKRSLRTAGITSGVVAGLTALISFSTYAEFRPVSLSEQIGKFVEAWNREGQDSIVDMTMERFRPDVRRRLANARRVHGWTRGWPKIGPTERSLAMANAREGGFVDRSTFPVSEGLLQIEWCIDLGFRDWSVSGLLLPLPKMDGSIEAFLRGWRSSDADAIVLLFPGSSREAARKTIRQHSESERWGATFPAIEFEKRRPLGEESAEVAFSIPGGRLRSIWRLNEADDWELHRIAWPGE